MDTSIGIIGGADGPTAIFVSGSGTRWFNVYGLIMVILILIPNIIYALKFREQENQCTNKAMNLLEQVGRYGCMALSVSGLGFHEMLFASPSALMACLWGVPALILCYWVCWIPWLRKKSRWNALALALLPTAAFFLFGITTCHPLLAVFAVLFGIGHTYVTLHNF